MGTAASSFLNPIAAELEGVDLQPTAKALARRAGQRRQIQGLVGVSYVVDAAILLLYAYAGTIPVMIAPAYAGCGLALVAINIALSESGFNERFKDHYLVAPQSAAVHGGPARFAYAAPEVGVMFLSTLFIMFSFCLAACDAAADHGDLDRDGARSRRTVPVDRQADRDAARHLSRTLATMVVFILTFGRCMFLGIFSSSMKQSLYQSGLS